MPHQLFIPVPGTIITLAEDWTFKLFFEHRNNTLLQALCPNPVPPMPAHYQPGSLDARYHGKWWGTNDDDHRGSPLLRWLEPGREKQLPNSGQSYRLREIHHEPQPYLLVTMPTGQQLKFESIHIRAKVDAYNIVTFRATRIGPDSRFHATRFWVELQEANKIICTLNEERSLPGTFLEFAPEPGEENRIVRHRVH